MKGKIDSSDVFTNFLKSNDINKFRKKDKIERIRLFLDWCNKNNFETHLLRLSSSEKNMLRNSNFLDFTTKRIIITSKQVIRNIFDTGYIAGLSPFLYCLVDDKIKIEDYSQGSFLTINDLLGNNSSKSIFYSEITEIQFKHGLDTLVHNMLGRAIRDNYFKIHTKSLDYTYVIPVRKNGTFEQISYWINAILPISIKKL